MIKRIPVSSLRVGMYMHALEGSWLDHGLWRRKFMVSSDEDRRAVVDSGARDCWIDLKKGEDVERKPAANVATRAAAATLADEARPKTPISDDRVPSPSVSFEEELVQASRLCKTAKQAVQQVFGDLRLGKALEADSLRPLVEDLSASVFRNPGALVNLARLKNKDDYTYMHSVAVCALMVLLARGAGLGATACREAGLAGLLHDVGKAVMPLDILNKPGKLTDAEFDVMRSHPVRGHAILLEGGAGAMGALDVCLHHHERMDGSGYPDKLSGENLSPMARMGAICDVYDAITSARPYKTAWDPADSLSRMASWTGHFDTVLFAMFVRSLGIYPSGSLVRLKSGRLAVVVKQHPTDLTTPTVKVFFSTRSNLHIPVVEVDLARQGVQDEIVRREARGQWGFEDLDHLWTGTSQTG